MAKMKWWGYLHTNGKISVKRYVGNMNGILEDARYSPFVQRVFSPFEAKDREEAEVIINNILKDKTF